MLCYYRIIEILKLAAALGRNFQMITFYHFFFFFFFFSNMSFYSLGKLFSESSMGAGEDKMAGEAGECFVSFLLLKQKELN